MPWSILGSPCSPNLFLIVSSQIFHTANHAIGASCLAGLRARAGSLPWCGQPVYFGFALILFRILQPALALVLATDYPVTGFAEAADEKPAEPEHAAEKLKDANVKPSENMNGDVFSLSLDLSLSLSAATEWRQSVK